MVYTRMGGFRHPRVCENEDKKKKYINIEGPQWTNFAPDHYEKYN